jgi:hypothetical protein
LAKRIDVGKKAETKSRPEGERERRKVSRTRILIEVSIIGRKPVTSTNTIWPKHMDCGY